MTDEETIIVNKKEYDHLISRDAWLNCLEGAGVDNWEGWDFAVEEWDRQFGEETDIPV